MIACPVVCDFCARGVERHSFGHECSGWMFCRAGWRGPFVVVLGDGGFVRWRRGAGEPELIVPRGR